MVDESGRSRAASANFIWTGREFALYCAPRMSAQFDVRYTAQLARLHLDEEEIARFQAQLGTVLEFVEKLRAVDVDGVEPTAHAFPVHNIFRSDEPRDGIPAELALKNAPRTANGLMLVPKVIE